MRRMQLLNKIGFKDKNYIKYNKVIGPWTLKIKKTDKTNTHDIVITRNIENILILGRVKYLKLEYAIAVLHHIKTERDFPIYMMEQEWSII